MSEWQEYRLGDLGRVVTGKTPSKKNPEDWGNAMPFVTPTDYGGFNKRAAHTERYLSHVGISRLSQKILPPNSVMVTCIGSDMGKIAINTFPVITNQQINSIIPNTNLVSSDFLYYRLVSMYEILRAYGRSGTAVPIVNKGDFENLKAKMPPLCEQEAIAAVLSSLDDKIDLLRRQNGTLESLAQALFRHWFVDGAAGDWEVVTVGGVAQLNASTVQKGYAHDLIEYLDTGSITEGRITGFQQFALEDAPSRAKRLVKHNDIIYSTVRPNQRHYGIIKNPQPNLVVSTGFCVLTCDKIDPHFLYLLLTQPDMTEFLHSVAEGSTSAYPSLRPADIASVEFQLPPKTKLEEFSNLAQSFWAKITHNDNQIRTLEKLRDTLLPKLMSGEVRVRL